MPLYEYQCENCGDVFEVMQKFSDEPLSVHEKCGGRVHRLLSAPALQFKGSGWYVTDYASKSNSKSVDNGSGKTEKTESSAPAASSGDTKTPAAKPAASSETKQ